MTTKEFKRPSEGRFDPLAFHELDGDVQSLGKWVFVDIYEREERESGLVLVESKKQHIRRAKVLSASEAAVEYGVKDGDDIIFADFRMEVLDGSRGFIDIDNICAVIE